MRATDVSKVCILGDMFVPVWRQVSDHVYYDAD